MDDLTQSWSCLSLLEREGPGCNLSNDDQNSDYSIIARFLTKRALNMDVIARTFNPLWRARNGFKITIGEHIILLHLTTKNRSNESFQVSLGVSTSIW